ncbi:MAG: NAD(P)H-hydrate dehydratase [Candidatus Aenigmarchaeota archaeon]|nr:NAD(P)H-hydrate dehydratase [Candidatus Aenigmarchaeota archaeon]
MKTPFMETSNRLVKEIYLPRDKFSKKGDYGKLLVIGGSDKYTGSAALVSLAAYASGCDLVWNAAPRRAADVMASFSPDIMAFPLKGDYLNKSHTKPVLKLSERADAIVIGNGLGMEKETMAAVLEIISKIEKPMVIDADAIKALTPKNHKILDGRDAVLTPHAYEMSVFSGKDVDLDLQKRIQLVTEFSSSLDVVIVLKGDTDVIGAKGKISINKTGNPYMTVGGTGDTLAGICGALISRGTDVFGAACVATFLNGLAGDMCAKDWGEGLTASKLIDYIPKAIKTAL